MERLSKHQNWVRAMFKNDRGEPFELTQGQSEIFHVISDPSLLRGTARTITQYGKSDTTAIALVNVATSRREKILVIAPTGKQADIIMSKVIQHLFDHDYFTGMIMYEGSLERLRNERSKTRITIRNGSEIFILTADAETLSKEGKSLMGFGATIIIVDESSLIPDQIWGKIFRMLGGNAQTAKLIQLGNPFERNHFHQSFHSDRYVKIVVHKDQAVAEGRITEEFLKEAKENMSPLDYRIFYENEFPEGGAEDTLIPWEWIDLAINQEGVDRGFKQVGLDVARFGRDKSIYLLRDGGLIVKVKESEKMDTMALVGWSSEEIRKDRPELVAVDVIGIGAGVFDRLDELTYDDDGEYSPGIVGVNVGESPSSDSAKKQFHNLRAEIYWTLREKFRPQDGRSRISIPDDPDLKRELQELRYRISSERKIRIEEKEKMKERIGRSPDKADALALAFADVNDVSMEIL